MSQCSKILSHMQEHGSITPLEAFSLYKSLACHSRIAELRDRGYQIATEMVETPTGKVVGRYRLQSHQNAPQRAAAPEPTRPATPAPITPHYEPYAPGQVRVMWGRRVEVLADGISAHDGTRFTEVRDLGPA